ncbi:MAG: EAL domain-containing protein [Hyphomicrobiales bacterium]|nr:EAL domain-containing protein [Hyphomicrobiales bacterium]
MTARQASRGEILLVSIFFAGTLAVAATYLLSNLITGSIHQQQLRQIGSRWADEVAGIVAANPADWSEIGRRLSAKLAGAPEPIRARNITIYDSKGARLAGTGPSVRFGLRGGLNDDAGDREAIRAAVAGNLVHNRLTDGTDARPIEFSDLYVPVDLGAAGSGALRIGTNDTGEAVLFSTFLENYTGLAALICWVVFMVPLAIAWRRTTVQETSEHDMQYFAHHDPLTGLPNRLHFSEKLADALARSKRHQTRLAVMYLDLDRFKEINDTYGHPAGDELLKSVSQRLRESIREMDTIGRLGGDEFAIIAEDLEDARFAGTLARRICTVLGAQYEIAGHRVTTSTSIGIAIAPEDGVSADILVKNADLALYRAKGEGRNTYRYFESEMDAVQQRRLQIERDLRLALQANEFSLSYQPQYDLQSGALCGYQVVPVWTHPHRGAIAPDVFIPIAEESGLIIQLGAWILREACRAAASWADDLKISVSLSPVQFRNKQLAATVVTALEQTGLDPQRLELEFTEKLLLQDTERMLAVLLKLRNIGVSIAMTEFGVGYSSLSHLSRLPFSNIKINRSFIEKLEQEPESTAVVNSIIGLGRSLEVTITADGVETPQQASFLKKHGCNRVQGYLFGQPSPETSAPPFVAEGLTDPSILARSA